MKEPPRNHDLESLWPPMQPKVRLLLNRMVARGLDPVIFEARRSEARQRWLYGIGRSHSLRRKPVTWTLHSRHRVGKAVDMISKAHGWGSEEFYHVMREELHKIPELELIPVEACHVQWCG